MSLSFNKSKKRASAITLAASKEIPASIKYAFIFLFFALIVFLIYSNTFDAIFSFDDIKHIKENPHIRLTQFSVPEVVKSGFSSSKTRPLPFMIFALDYYFHGYDVFGYHVVNITIHLLTGFFLFLFLKTTLNFPTLQDRYKHPDIIAFCAALVGNEIARYT